MPEETNSSRFRWGQILSASVRRYLDGDGADAHFINKQSWVRELTLGSLLQALHNLGIGGEAGKGASLIKLVNAASHFSVGATVESALEELYQLASGGGGGSGCGLSSEVIPASSFTLDGDLSVYTLAAASSGASRYKGAKLLFRNGAATMIRVDVIPTSAGEFQIDGDQLLIYGDVTGESLDAYTVLYPVA